MSAAVVAAIYGDAGPWITGADPGEPIPLEDLLLRTTEDDQ